ncbi:hypothetical protein B0H65DRAFT_40305 [Neurospora tetraspora]|uniref:Secreted protein n=1 Tax=Neurospora tetraspora TaxID=94610 RepID=A0AAE0JP95_9PEZI|nr:hypothetical protein B0H65DRAFT_40305 [Neurospora tetraspora]
MKITRKLAIFLPLLLPMRAQYHLFFCSLLSVCKQRLPLVPASHVPNGELLTASYMNSEVVIASLGFRIGLASERPRVIRMQSSFPSEVRP